MNNAVVSLQEVGFFFGVRPLLKKINLSLFSGRIVLLCGENGVGKSTLLKLLAGIFSPTTGKIDYFVAPDKIVFLGHASVMYPALSAFENLAFWADMYGLKNADLKNLLQLVGLREFACEKVKIFSKGMAQRLHLARILLLDADLILLDEPTAGLDEPSRKFFYDCVGVWKQKSKAILWVSHDLEKDGKMADSICFLQKGRLEEQKTAERKDV